MRVLCSRAILWLAIACFSSNAAMAKCTLNRLAELPVSITPRGPAATVTLDGTSVLLSINSSESFSTISFAEAKILQIKPAALPKGVRVYSGSRALNAGYAKVGTLGVGSAKLKGVEFIVGGDDDRTANLTAGSLGQNVLRARDIEYDLPDGLIRLLEPEGCGDEPMAYWSGQQPYSVMNILGSDDGLDAVSSTVRVNGVSMRAIFATNIPFTILDPRAASRAGVKVEPAAKGDLGTRMVGSVTNIQLGDEDIKTTRIQIASLAQTIDMLVGDDFFLSHRVYMAFSRQKMYFTYLGGPVFNFKSMPVVQNIAGGAAPVNPADPADAEGFSRRAEISVMRGRNQSALDDLDHACRLAPNEARYFRQRAAVHSALSQMALAEVDLDTVLRLTPDDPAARVERAALRVKREDDTAARQDLDAAATVAPKESDLRLRIGDLYANINQFGPAVAQLDLWIAAHRDDRRYAWGLNDRCWARALAGRELDLALIDCDEAVNLTRRAPDALDSRAMVRLRKNEFWRAIEDYNAALARKPTSAWSLYGRGLAELKTGSKAQGDADIAAAAQIAPHVAERAVRLGLTP